MEFIIISGLSGAGKSKAASFMEDMGFFCVDNLPAPLIPKFAELGMAGTGEYDRVVLVTDVRSGTNFSALFQSLEALKGMKCPYRILYMDASDDVIIKRYKETRRSHPLAEECDSLEGAIALERRMLAPLRERAEFVVDTSDLSTAKLRGELLRLFGRGSQEGAMTVSVTSFGFKHGLPREADLVFDVRFLPNPYYEEGLRRLTGEEQCVRDYVMQGGTAKEFLDMLSAMMDFLLPHYISEGKNQLVIAIGCTGGKHRSVTIAKGLYDHLKGFDQYGIKIEHRDIDKE